MTRQDGPRDAATREREHQERADRRYARLDRFTKPAAIVMIAAFIAVPVILIAAARGWEAVLIVATIVGVGGALCAGAYRIAYEFARQAETRARYERAGVRPLSNAVEAAATLALVVAIALFLFGSDLAAILADMLGGGRWLTLLLWLLISAIAGVLLIVPAIPLIERGFRAGIDALPTGRSPLAAARRRAVIVAAILLAISGARMAAYLL